MSRTTVTTLVLAALLLAGAIVGYRLVFSDAQAGAKAPLPRAPARTVATEPTPVTADVEAVRAFALADVVGTVEVRRGDTWVAARAGDTVAPGEAIRTGDGGRATLRTPEGDELTLRPRVELEVDTLDRTVTELTLRRGKVRAAAGEGRDRLQINSGEARAVGKASGRFTVYADARGAVTVASESGDVQVLAQGRAVTVGARQETTVEPGASPTDPVAVPDEVFLTVAWPEQEIHQRSAVIRGRTRPGTVVVVDGKEAEVGGDGKFSVNVPLKEGANEVQVVAESIDGKEKREGGKVKVDTKGPPLEADPSKLYDTKPKPKQR